MMTCAQHHIEFRDGDAASFLCSVCLGIFIALEESLFPTCDMAHHVMLSRSGESGFLDSTTERVGKRGL